MNEYEQRKAEKAEYYREQAQKATGRSNAAYNASGTLADSIPFGQPILVGHHSEGRARRDHERIHNLMSKSIEEKNKAEYYTRKAENAESNRVISSDDPEAINKLKEKLAGLEKRHLEIKAIPKDKRTSWALPYSSAEIKRVKDRIADLEAKQNIPEIDKTINGVQMKSDKVENRLRLFFPSIPSEEVRTKLKQNGFKWSQYNQAWQRQINNAAIYAAEYILGELKAV
jgi:hypothetical protein